jgi:hypothetical protein
MLGQGFPFHCDEGITMSAVVKSLGLYDLLASQFLAGFQFPDHIDKYLSILAVADLQTTSDPGGVLYTGTVFFPSSPGSPPVLQHQDPSGAIFDFHDITLQFRLLVPRSGSAPVKTVIDTIATTDAAFVPVQQIVNAFGPQGVVGTDYPGIGFQLELLLTVLTFHLGNDWKPAKQNSDFTVTADPHAATQDVRILMPKILLRYTQAQDFTQAPVFKLASWGDPGFDAPNDLSEGELATMDPPLAIHSSGRVAFGVDEIILDLSEDSTPPEILSHFGTDESFEGLYVKALQVYYADANKDFALNFAVRDALISFKGEVSLEAELDLLFADAPFKVDVKMYDGQRSLPVNLGSQASGAPPPNTWTGGSATVPPGVVIYLQVAGGTPPFTYKVDFTPTGGSVQHLWDDSTRQAKFTPPPTSSVSGTLVITVTDSSATPQTYSNTMALSVAVAGSASLPPPNTSLAQAQWHPDPPPAGIPPEDQIQFSPSSSGTSETLVVLGGSVLPTVTLNGASYAIGPDRQVIVDVEPGASAVPIRVDYSGGSQPDTFRLLFDFDKPETVAIESTYVSPGAAPADVAFNSNTVPDGVTGGAGHIGGDALRYWVENALDLSQPIQITASASNEGHVDKGPYNLTLSQRRGDVAQQIVQSAPGAPAPTVAATGQTTDTSSNPQDRVAVIHGTGKSASAYTLTGNIDRAATPAPAPVPAPTTPPAPPGPPTNSKPAVLRRLSFRVRLERNVPVLMEVSGEVDFETETEKSLRSASGQTGSLGLQPTTAATKNPNPADGTVDFTLNVTWDPATHDLTETITLGAAPADIDGLLRMTNPAPFNTLKNILGSVMIFTPILNAATKALDPNSAGDWTAIAIDLGVPVGIGALGFINTTDVTLFGGELQLRENIPGGSDPAKFTNAALTFDYSVGFRIDVDALDIHSSRSMSVRYKAVGVNLHFGDPPKFEFVLDTSKGYSLDLSDPALFNLPGGLGDIMKIAAARIAQFNPLTIELDLEIKADLGIITVDKFLVKIPLDGASSPMIIPSGVKINIPATLIGSGTVSIDPGGFQGTIDITLVPVKLRIAASIGVEHISAPPREATAFYLGLEVDFPAPIVLGSTGLGLFGLFGLFGMNYAMKEDPPIPGDAVGPDLRWLIASGGAPYKLNVGGVQLWEPKIDNWAFGVGVVLGTVDGFLINLRGAFILELPGPRIIITVNLEVITSIGGLSSDGMDATSLDVGIIGILDLDFGAGQITLGVMIDLEIASVISIQIPIQLFFDWNQPSEWHFWIGTISTPASANILGIVRGGGYFMIGGQAITPFPPGSSGSLPGVAVALGISASIIWGSEDIGIYIKVAASADFGVSFSPKLFIVGQVHLEGELRLIIISISVTGDFLVKAPSPLYLSVHVCGSISFFFFSISACVDFAIGNDSIPLPPPPLFEKMYLQSYAPVIASGQGGDRPIDASLGDAIMVAAAGLPGLTPASGTLPTVPIDSVPVLQLLFGVDTSTVSQTFTSAIPACVTYPGNPGVSLGGGRSARYKLTSLTITPPLPGGVKPPVAWRPNKPAAATAQTQVDLAMFSRNPNVVNSAVERSTELSNTQISIWGDVCEPIAPPVCVFWTLCGQRLGPSPNAWKLFGIPIPDPPNTKRTSPVPTTLQVEQPTLSAADALLVKFGLALTGKGLFPAQVIGIQSLSQPGTPADDRTRCFRALELPELLARPFDSPIDKEFRVSDPNALIKRLSGILADDRWLRFDTNHSNRVRLLLGVQPAIFKRIQDASAAKWILIRQRDSKHNLISEVTLTSLNPRIVNALADLPATWIANPGPWFLEAASVFTFLSSIKLTQLLVEIKPEAKTTIIEVAYLGDITERPTVVVGAIESCPVSETDRYKNGEIIQASTIQQIQTYLDGGSPVPLLEKGTVYTITANYDVTVTEQDSSTTEFPGVTQSWSFKTDTQIPPKLDPWVLSTAPDQNEKFFFYEDPVDVIFNDQSLIQLFGKLGYQLELDLRAADGLPDTTAAPVTTVSVSGVGTAAYDSLQQLVASGKLPCVGATSQYQNQKFTAPVKLRPLMGYTLDINTNPSTTPPPDPTKAVAPLFRRAFNTGKYPTMTALAKDLGASLVVHRPLKQKLTFPLAPHTVMPDQDIQNGFMAAGEQALPAAAKNAIVIYWVPSSPGGPYVPHAILIDSVEPLWRTRQEPVFTNPIPTDPSFKIVTINPVTALEVTEVGGPSIGGYVVSPGGTRTVVLFTAAFAPPPGGTTVTLALHRPASSVYGLANQVDVIVALPVAPKAPWENDHV